MTTTITPLLMSLMLMWSMKSSNPIKVSMSILTTSCMMFFTMSFNSGLAWFSIILLLLFMGGIIMMFMILSSILPNEKSMKAKKIMIVMILLVSLSMASPATYSLESVGFNTKTFLISGSNFFLMLSIVLFYFLGSMSTLSSEQTPMRSLSCHQTLIL